MVGLVSVGVHVLWEAPSVKYSAAALGAIFWHKKTRR